MRATRGDVSGGWGAGTCGGVGVGLGRTGGGGEGLVRSGDGGEGLVWSGVGEAVSALVERDWFGLVVGRGPASSSCSVDGPLCSRPWLFFKAFSKCQLTSQYSQYPQLYSPFSQYHLGRSSWELGETRRVFPYFPRLSGAPIIPRRPDEFVPWSGLRGNELDGSQAKSAAKRNHLRACVGDHCLPPSVLRFRTEHRGGPADRRERWEWTEVEEMRSRRLTGVEGVRLRSLEVGGGWCGEEGDGDARGRRKRMAVREWTGWRWMWGRGCGWREWWWLKRRTGEERWVEEGMDGLQMDGQRGEEVDGRRRSRRRNPVAKKKR
ncbi:unnamed protein product [Arctogadus glacialis]